MTTDVKVKGMKELATFLNQLPDKLQNNIMRGALAAGARIIRDEAKREAPEATGKLRDGIKVSTRLKQGTATASVKTTGPHAFLAQWMEFGVGAHKIVAEAGGTLSIADGVYAREVDHPGVAPRPFMRPALESQSQRAVVASAEYIKKRLTKEGINGAGEVDIEPEES